jgi:hypothetical protein
MEGIILWVRISTDVSFQLNMHSFPCHLKWFLDGLPNSLESSKVDHTVILLLSEQLVKQLAIIDITLR